MATDWVNELRAAFALSQLVNCAKGFYTFDDLLLQLIRAELAGAQ